MAELNYANSQVYTEEERNEFAIGFAHFLAEHTYSCYKSGWSNDFGKKELTTKELLEIYKKKTNN